MSEKWVIRNKETGLYLKSYEKDYAKDEITLEWWSKGEDSGLLFDSEEDAAAVLRWRWWWLREMTEVEVVPYD
jgi:hypothetical protein